MPSPTTLLKMQQEFSTEAALLILEAVKMGYQVTLGDAFRDPRTNGEVGVKMGYGHPRSCHKLRLAIDLNLFRDGKFLQTEADHAALGAYWKSRSPHHTWGGEFKDANHYSFTWDGMR